MDVPLNTCRTRCSHEPYICTVCMFTFVHAKRLGRHYGKRYMSCLNDIRWGYMDAILKTLNPPLYLIIAYKPV